MAELRLVRPTSPAMKEVTPTREREAWRGKPTTTQPWPELVRYWADFARDMPHLEPLHHLVAALASSPASSSLFGRVTWHGIALSDTLDFPSTDNTLEIDFYERGKHFEFRHRTFAGHDDREDGRGVRGVGDSEIIPEIQVWNPFRHTSGLTRRSSERRSVLMLSFNSMRTSLVTRAVADLESR